MYRQKNTVGNLENVGFSLDGHEGLYNIYMMEEIQSIFAVGAGAVTKLVKCRSPFSHETEIKRIFRPKYPYEYLREFNAERHGTHDKPSERETAIEFFGKRATDKE
jgi:oxygen-independent coproporphyrinogen-3 oxidase